MKKNIAYASVILLFFTGSALAVFDAAGTETYSSLSGWNKSGDVALAQQSSNTFASLGNKSTNNNSMVWCSFVAPASGNYVMGFDYRFVGSDVAFKADDIMSAGIGEGQPGAYDDFMVSSSTGLTGSATNPGAWHAASMQPITLQAGQTYWAGFELKESRLLRSRWVNTRAEIDNVCLTRLPDDTLILPASQIWSEPVKVRNVPAPAAILLSCIGIGLVGWLRHRNAL
jgi:hypothetical protein